MALTLSYPTLSSTIIKAEHEANYADISNKFGSIDNSDIKTGASIDVDKLSAQYEHTILNFCAMGGVGTLSGGWPAANTIIGIITVPGAGQSTNWTLSYCEWACTDTGDGAATFDLQWGWYNGATWTNVASLLNPDVTLANSAGLNDANDGVATIGSSTLSYHASAPRHLAIIGTSAASATTLSAGILSISVMLSRKIASS